MADVLSIALIIAFFALAVVFVRACERIVGPDLEPGESTIVVEPDQAAA